MIKLTCNSCGGKLEITDDIERFACGHCGAEWLVNRGGGIISLKSIENNLEKISNNSEKTAEHSKILADEIRVKKIKEKISSLNKDLEKEQNEYEMKLNVLHEEKKKISLNPQKQNKIKSQINFIINPLCILSFLILIIVHIIMQQPNTGVNPNIIPPIYMHISTIAFVVLLACAFICNGFFDDNVPDEKQKEINIEKVKEIEKEIQNLSNDKVQKIEKEINDLKNKAKEIEESFLK